MKPIFATASALALIFTAAACTGANDSTDRAAYDTQGDAYETRTETSDMASVQGRTDTVYGDNQTGASASADTNRDLFTLASDELKASNLIGADVRNTAGDDIAKVADVWLGENGESSMLIVEDGGVLGIGSQRYSVSFDDVTLTPAVDRDEAPNLIFRTAGDSLETLPEFDKNGVNEHRLASEMMGKTADFALRDESARIDDLIINTNGEARYAIISPGLLSSNQVVIDADTITRAEGDSEGELVITLTEDVFAKAKAYRNR